MKSAALFACLFLAGSPLAARAQSAGPIIERHLKAIGGEKAVEKIVSTEIVGTVTASDGRSGTFTQRARRPNRFSISVSSGDTRWRAGFNGRAAWQDDRDGLRTLFGQPASRVRAEATFAATRLLTPDKILEFIAAGRDQVRGRPVFVVLAITADGVVRRLFFDASSYLLAKDEPETDAGVEERLYDDYRAVGQLLEPHRIEWRRGGDTFHITVERVVHNAPIDAQAFDVPAPTAQPPVNLDAALAAAERHERGVDDLLASYTYTVSGATGRMDDTGRVTTQEGAAWEVLHVNGRRVLKQIRTQRGEPLNEAEQRREDGRVATIITALEKGGTAPAGPPQGGIVLFRSPSLSTFRRVSGFSNVRRESVGGRPTIVVEFAPQPEVRTGTEVEEQAAVTAGTIWIDEALHYITRQESFLLDDYERVAGGSALRFERALMNDEVWLPVHRQESMRLKFAFGNRSQMFFNTDYTEHKKFAVQTDATIELPPQQ